ncbi:hypothetical protein KFE25_009715 [Diacronema lutheri]|uniref:Protein phosphatase 1 regulatory subunit 7 n=2 Tax=Diacronema lutheri TaxID=2081491 RepID=A0A8J6CG18_DIALT|nr:hypothetical protein KFE25_009715 [Diacronema lutheri]
MAHAITPAQLSELTGRAPAEIESLALVGMSLSDISAVGCCHALRKLSVDSNRLASLGGVEELPELHALSAQHNELGALEVMRGLPKLATLNLSHNRLTTLGTALREATALKALLVTDNALRRLDLHLLKPLRELNTVVASRNQISEVSGAEKLPSLRKLSLSNNELRALGPLPSSLQELRLAHNRIAALPQALSACARLALLDVGSNLLASLEQLAPLTDLERLRNLTLRGNPLCDAVGSSYRLAVKRRLARLRLLDGAALGVDGGAGANRKIRFGADDTPSAPSPKQPLVEQPLVERAPARGAAGRAPARAGAADAAAGVAVEAAAPELARGERASGKGKRNGAPPPADKPRADGGRAAAAERAPGAGARTPRAGGGAAAPAVPRGDAPARRSGECTASRPEQRAESAPPVVAVAPVASEVGPAGPAVVNEQRAAGKKRKRRSRALPCADGTGAAVDGEPAGVDGSAPHPKERAAAKARGRVQSESDRPVEGEVETGIVALEDKRCALGGDEGSRGATLALLEQLTRPAAGFESW